MANDKEKPLTRYQVTRYSTNYETDEFFINEILKLKPPRRYAILYARYTSAWSQNLIHEYVGNLHNHSIYSDGHGSHDDIALAAIQAGLDFSSSPITTSGSVAWMDIVIWARNACSCLPERKSTIRSAIHRRIIYSFSKHKKNWRHLPPTHKCSSMKSSEQAGFPSSPILSIRRNSLIPCKGGWGSIVITSPQPTSRS